MPLLDLALWICAAVAICSAEDTTKYFDKTIPDVPTPLTADDFERAKYVSLAGRSKRQTNANEKAMYNRNLFEGDITKVNRQNLASILAGTGNIGRAYDGAATTGGVQRNAIRDTSRLWPGGIIPYTVSSQFSAYSRAVIAAAMDEYTRQTCIRFRPKGNQDSDWVNIAPDDGCYSTVGKDGGMQTVSIGDGCVEKGIVMHELMHSAGFFHEQSRTDRDGYVTVKWENVESGMENQFDKYSQNLITLLGVAYDYGSIMHYSKTAFSKNGLNTLVPIQPGVMIGQRVNFSPVDIYKINILYGCDTSGSGSSITAPTPRATAPPTSVVLPSGGECSDMSSECRTRAQNGDCVSNSAAAFMRTYCARTCSFCQVSNPAPAPVPSVGSVGVVRARCADDGGSFCNALKLNNQCQGGYAIYARQNCRLSCGFC
uniref:Metalloendopeptidase n=1 Tax=Plectus sambesii TaxID=2011161 RepID=A0A914XEH6_9BILA